VGKVVGMGYTSLGEAKAVVEAIEELEQPKSKERPQQAGKQYGRGKIASTPGSQAIKGRTREKVGKALGVSGATYDRAKAVVAAAEKRRAQAGGRGNKKPSAPESQGLGDTT
jgi:hypothetical protein